MAGCSVTTTMGKVFVKPSTKTTHWRPSLSFPKKLAKFSLSLYLALTEIGWLIQLLLPRPPGSKPFSTRELIIAANGNRGTTVQKKTRRPRYHGDWCASCFFLWTSQDSSFILHVISLLLEHLYAAWWIELWQWIFETHWNPRQGGFEETSVQQDPSPWSWWTWNWDWCSLSFYQSSLSHLPAKNIVLMGVASLTLHDKSTVELADLSSHVLASVLLSLS